MEHLRLFSPLDSDDDWHGPLERSLDVWTTNWSSRRWVGSLLVGALTVCLVLFAGSDNSMFDTSMLGSPSAPLDIFAEEPAPPPPPASAPPLTVQPLASGSKCGSKRGREEGDEVITPFDNPNSPSPPILPAHPIL
jgi:hypothetical protein